MLVNRADTPQKKRQVVNALLSLWERYPDLRLMQLIGNAFDDAYYIEDFELLGRLERFYAEIEKQNKGKVNKNKPLEGQEDMFHD